MTYAQHANALRLFSLTLFASAALVACGGGDSDSDDDGGTAPTLVTTTVMDGLIGNALVCADVNNNDSCDGSEPQARTDANGKAVLNVSGLTMASVRLLAVVGTDAVDADFGAITQAYTLKTPGAEASVISPLTTLVQARMDAGDSLDAAKSTVKAQLGGISPTDNFVKNRATNAEDFRAGLVARMALLKVVNGTSSWSTVVNQLVQINSDSSAAAAECAAMNTACDAKLKVLTGVSSTPTPTPTPTPDRKSVV